MITKERIDELLSQKAKIWGIGRQGNVFCVGLKFRPETLKNKKWLENKYEIYSKFFETKEEAEWHKEFGCIERTERLELPTWEEFIKNYQTLGDNTILDERCVMFTSKTKTYSLYADDNLIWVGCDNTGTSFFCEDLNKENYIKACRFCKRLFLGELDLGEKK